MGWITLEQLQEYFDGTEQEKEAAAIFWDIFSQCGGGVR